MAIFIITSSFKGHSYFFCHKGKVSRTVDGFTCQRWDSQEPHSHSVTGLNNEENYCRNINREQAPWCYTTNNNTRFDYCSIPKCQNLLIKVFDTKLCYIRKVLIFIITFIQEHSPCYLDPCKNGGTCTVDGTSYRCECLKIYSGANCETQLEIEPENCKRTRKGFDYRGKTNVTKSGYTCQRWDSQSPHAHRFSSSGLPENYCRNPDGEPALWCYTTDPNKRWEICNISDCGEFYYGATNTTEDGLQCQRWDSQSPHKHSYGYLSDQENYCRNPYGESSKPWCYTVTSKRWDYCIVPVCSMYTLDLNYAREYNLIN
ncbi:hypothetical protein KUTeg_023512 [Tegillarca granosa]|uniref:Plasminogen n=1 Tax=Tegillarca granosa TaxID=220873 RepID=A0ABQ9E2E6_TEGGR|nr:hypothetical protein KUTeg_023512 [Tegillarca granosa]